MPAQRLSMRKLKEVLRLTYDSHLSQRQVARSLSLSKTTVNKYLELTKEAGLSWPLPGGMDDTALVKALFPGSLSSWSQQFTSRTSPPSIRNSSVRLSRSNCCGKNMPRSTRRPLTSIHGCGELYKEWRQRLRVSM